jgi:hypothetical protein
MNGINLIFKIIENYPITKQLVVKFSRKNSRDPIDSYRAYTIDYSLLDFSDAEKFTSSLTQYGIPIVEEQIRNEPILNEHKDAILLTSTDIDNYIGKIVIVNSNILNEGSMQKINLDI